MSKPVEIEYLAKDSLSPVIDDVGAKTDMLSKNASGVSKAYELMTQQISEGMVAIRGDIALLESELEGLRLVMATSSPDLDQTENCIAIEQLENHIKELKKKLLDLESVSNSIDIVPPDVEQSKRKVNGLHNSIQQMSREMPSLAMGPQTFFLAISNNLPIFTDEVARARKEYNNLIQTGQKATPVWKQILSSLFSWQTALTTGIMLLVMYGDEIVDWVGSLFKGEKQLTATERAQRGLNEAIKENGYGIGDKILLVKRLSDEWASLGGNLDEQEQFIKDNREEFEKLGVAVTNVTDAENLLVTNTPEFLEALRLRAEAAAAQKLATEEFEKALIAERKATELEEKTADMPDRIITSYTPIYENTRGGVRQVGNRANFGDNKEKQKMEKDASSYRAEAESIREVANAYYDKAVALELSAKAKIKEVGVDESDEAAQKEKEAEEAKRKAEEAKRLAKQQKDLENRLAKDLRKQKWDNEQADIDLTKDGSEKRIRQIKLDYEKAIAEIDEQEARWKEAQGGNLTAEQKDALKKSHFYAQTKMRNDIEAVEVDEVQKGREKLEALLDEYKTYDQRRRDIDEAYNRDLAIYNAELENLRNSGGDTSQIEASVQARTDAYKEEIQSLENDILRSTDFYDKLFSDVSVKGYKVLKKFYSQAKDILENAKVSADTVTVDVPVQDADGKFVKKTVKITVAEFEKMKQRIIAIQKDLEKNNPFAAFKTSWTELMSAIKNGGDVAGALKNIDSKGKELTSTIRGWGKSLDAVFGDRFGQSCNEMMDMVDGVVSMGTGIGQIFTGDIVGGITNTLSGLGSIVETISSWKEKQEALKREWYIAEIETERAQRIRNQEYVAQLDTIQDIISQQKILNWLVEKGFSKPNSVSVWEAHSLALKEYKKNLEDEIKTYDQTEFLLRNSFAYWEWGTSADGGSEMHRLGDMSAAEIELYYQQGKLTDGAKAYYEAWVASGKTIEELKKNIEETYATMQEMVMGTSFDGFLNNVGNALHEARGDVRKFANFAEETIANGLFEAFKYQYLADAIKPLYDELSKAFIDGTATEDYLDKWKRTFENTMKEANDRLEQIGETAGVDPYYDSATTQTGKSGAFSAMSQEQGTKLEGLFVSGQMHWASIDEHSEDISESMRVAENHLAKIEENTGDCAKELKEVKEEIKKLNRDGLKVK